MTPRGHYILACLLAAGMLIYLTAGAPDGPPSNRSASNGISADCDIHRGPCTRPLDGGSVTLDIAPKPVRAMTDLTFRLTLAGPAKPDMTPPDRPFIDLDMPDMFMGYNRIYLTREKPGVYAGTGVIVRCPSGIPTWKAVVTVPGAGEVTFVFDVLY